jgi:alpha-galactosidase
LAVLGFSLQALAVSATPEELAEARSWVVAKLEGASPPAPAQPGLVVLANYKKVQQNARDGQPLKIGGIQYARGLYTHAPSRILVRLPGAGAAFTATVGIDNNGAYSGGSVGFKVSVKGQEVFSSKVMRRGEAGVPLKVDLGGATEFVMVVTDAGDNFYSDQASWADAKATLTDGREVWLGDLPIVQRGRGPYSAEPPFSFHYDGKASAELLKSWPLNRATRKLDERRSQHTLTWSDPGTRLEVRWVAIEYRDFPTVEWTLYFKNAGSSDTPILADLLALDTRLERGAEGEYVLHHHKGTFVRADDFEPLTTVLPPNQKRRFAPPGGRPLGQVFPYYNVEWPGEGLIVVVGWPGQWAAEFARDEGAGLRVAAGQEQTHLFLRPGEEIRTPLIVLQFYKGDWLRAQNLWRRWMLAHNLPRRGGKLPEPMMPAVSGNQFPGLLCNEADELRYIDRYLEEGIKISHWWMDAGWYVNKGDWTSTGTWEVDKGRFPRGLRHISAHAHARGIKLLVWFEPERVTAGSWLAEQHPEWVLGGKQGGLLDLGNPQAWQWLVDHFDKLITEQGIDFYRQDFNMDPLPYWRGHDATNRQGITEIKHVQGYLAFWDELVRRHPDMLIDTCASGGHRNDLETLRRAVPLLRSDYIFDSVGEQCHTYGLAPWMPFYGTGFIDFNAYIVRSLMGPNTTLSCDARRKDLDWPLLRKLVAQWREIVPNYFGDFHPLTPYSLGNDAWMAWQFDRPEAGEGIVQAFRRAECIFRVAELRLRGLDGAANYLVTDLDVNQPRQMSGRELMDKGLAVEIPDRPAAVVIKYEKVKPGS